MDNLNLENPEYVDKLENVEKADIIKENVEKIFGASVAQSLYLALWEG